MTKILMVLLASILVTAAHTPASASGKKVKLVLVTTGADANASGKASLALKQASVGQFEIQVRKLAPKATFQVIVDGVHVGDLVTNGGGGEDSLPVTAARQRPLPRIRSARQVHRGA